jgi:hypothetical protein
MVSMELHGYSVDFLLHDFLLHLCLIPNILRTIYLGILYTILQFKLPLHAPLLYTVKAAMSITYILC